MKSLRQVPKGWRHDPSYAGGKAFLWVAKPPTDPRTWVAFPGPKGGWFVKDKTPGTAEPALHLLTTLEGFEQILEEENHARL